jgi:pyruvate-ferredoxin/flavodoxin oxidoreductase
VPLAYHQGQRHLLSPERKKPGSGGVFSIFVSDLCKGCAACVTACGDHEALKMVLRPKSQRRARDRHGLPRSAAGYFAEVLGLFNAANPADSKTATLRNLLMVRSNYDALVSGDGACAGCGEKSVLRAIAAVTEAYMRPVYHAKSDRFLAKAGELEKNGATRLAALAERNPEEYALLKQLILASDPRPGRRNTEDTKSRIARMKRLTARSPICRSLRRWLRFC